MPDGKLALLLINGQHGIDDIVYAFGLDEGHQGIEGAIGIPEGEDGIIIKRRLFNNLTISAAVAAVVIVVEGGRDHGVIKGGIENFLLGGVGGLHFYFPEGLFPFFIPLADDGVKIPGGDFGGDIGERSFAADIGDADL